MRRLSGSAPSASMSSSATGRRMLPRTSVKKLWMRCPRSVETFQRTMNSRMRERSSLWLTPSIRSWITAFVTPLMKEENNTSPRRTMPMANIRSFTLTGETSLVAGVNCVKDQCRATA